MQILGSITNIPLAFPPKAKVFTTVVRAARDLPYALILSTSSLRSTHSAISFVLEKGFQPDVHLGSVPRTALPRSCYPARPPLLSPKGTPRSSAVAGSGCYTSTRCPCCYAAVLGFTRIRNGELGSMEC